MYLHTFGGVAIEADTGDGPVPSLGPRRLALLAIVAAAGARGITREKVIGILWPDRDEEQARHTLSQTLYLLRREAGAAWVSGSTQLHAAITSDVARFQEALSAGQLPRAAALYTGPFLDGFYLAGAPDFEQWVEETRARLKAAACKALETLARNAVAADAPRDAAGWWQRLLELDPFNATYAAGCIRTLAACDDHARARNVAREYEARVRHELDTEPDPVIGQLMAELRPQPEPAARPSAESHTTGPAVFPGDRTVAAPPEAVVASPPEPRPRRLRFRVYAAAVAVLATGAVAWQVGGARSSLMDPLPFLAIGAIEARDTATLGPVLRDMLATNLGRMGDLRVVANSRLLELLPRGADDTSAATADAARRAGATEIVEGELSTTADGMLLTLRRVAIRTGEVVQGYTVRAPDVFALTDSVTAAIAHDLGIDPPPGGVTTVRTHSSVAYALYEQGQRAFYGGDYAEAAQLMYAALGRDSTFAMAATYAWRSSINLARFDEANRDLPIVKRLAARAPERERLLIEAMIARYGGAPLPEALASARRLTERYPEEPDGHFLLGQALYSAGEWQHAIDAFNRAIAIDSTAGANRTGYCRICESIAGVRDSYLWFDSAEAAVRTARRATALLPGSATGWALIVEPLVRQGRRAEAEAANATASRLSRRSAVDYHSLHRDLIRTGRLDELETRIVTEVETAPPELIGELPWLLAFVLRNQGRARAAIELATRNTVPGTSRRVNHYDPWTGAIATLEAGRPREAARLFLEMANEDRKRSDGTGFIARSLSWHMTLAATAFAEAGDTAMVRALADSVQRIGQQSSIGRDGRLPHFLRGLLLQRQRRHVEAVAEFRRALFSTTDGYTRINLELARSLTALGRYGEAIAILQPAMRGGIDGSNSYVTHTELHESLAHAFHAAGQLDSARTHYLAVERAWRKADPAFADRYTLARTHAAALTPQR